MPPPLKPSQITPFGRRLRAVRKHFGAEAGRPDMTQADFAAALRVTEALAYRRYERGEIDPPMRVLRRIRELTGVSLCYLACGLPAGLDLSIEGKEPMTTEPMTTVGKRLRWVREAQAPLAVFARLMRVTPGQWQRWEEDVELLPIETATEAAHRLSVTLDYIYLGKLNIPAPRVLQDLLGRHPELAEAAESAPPPADALPAARSHNGDSDARNKRKAKLDQERLANEET
jgi:transcriptional regulator with XRE-family HTH domain